MNWTDNGILLSIRRHGESSAIVSLLTREHGRHCGLVYGATGKRMRGMLEPGNILNTIWRARLSDHLGTYSLELIETYAAFLLTDPLRLVGLQAACAVAEATLPERELHTSVYEGLHILLDSLRQKSFWATTYVKWELGLLEELGFGLDFTVCAATGVTDNLVYVSPKSGRAVSEKAGYPYKDKLLPLPKILRYSNVIATPKEILQGLELTGFFLERHVLMPYNKTLPESRKRLIDRLHRNIK